jgi:hypothetical protein
MGGTLDPGRIRVRAHRHDGRRRGGDRTRSAAPLEIVQIWGKGFWG